MLDALARHFDALCAVPAFYDLLTSSPALTQPMVSLLSEEVRARLNLAPVCQNLYEVASALGFRWEDGRTDFRRTFRARAFDNRRTFLRDAATGERRADFAQPTGATSKRSKRRAAALRPRRVGRALRRGDTARIRVRGVGAPREEAQDGRGPRSQARGFAVVSA